MNNVPNNAIDQVNTVMQGATMPQLLCVGLLSCLFLIALLWLVWKILDFRLEPLKDVPKTLVDIKIALSKMWSNDQLNQHIDARATEAVRRHEKEYHECIKPKKSSMEQD